jgi:DNA-binding CsgD family transcriptional regulator
MTSPELSDRELEVLQLVAQGMSNLEISAALGITESTVKSNMNQATIIALKRGIASL